MELSEFLQEALKMDSMEALIAENEASMRQNAKSSLIMQALCEDMGLQVSDGDIADYFKNNLNVTDYSQYLQQYGRPYLALLTREDMAKRLLAQEG